MQKKYLYLKNFITKNSIFLIIFFSYIPFFLLIPPFENNDEKEHIKIIASLSAGFYPQIPSETVPNLMPPALSKIEKQYSFTGGVFELPSFESATNLIEREGDYTKGSRVSYEAFYPPLYYFVSLLFFFFSKISNYLVFQYYLLSLSNALFYFAFVFVTYKLFLKIFINKKTAKNILLFLAINPYVLKMAVGVNPDIGFSFITLLFLYFILTKQNAVLLSTLSAVSILTKLSGIFTNITFMLLLLTQKVKRKIRSIVLFEVIFLLISAPWYIFVYTRYGTFLPETYSSICSKVTYPDSYFLMIFEIIKPILRSITHYSGFLMGFGWSYPFTWFFTIYALLFISLAGIGTFAAYKNKSKYNKIFLIFSLSLILFLLALSTKQRIIDSYDCDIPGRYILPIFPILCFYIFKGLEHVLKNSNLAQTILVCFGIFHYYFALMYLVVARYYV